MHTRSDFEIAIAKITEALCEYERRVFRGQSEVKETVTLTRKTIAQSRRLMAEMDALIARVQPKAR